MNAVPNVQRPCQSWREKYKDRACARARANSSFQHNARARALMKKGKAKKSARAIQIPNSSANAARAQISGTLIKVQHTFESQLKRLTAQRWTRIQSAGVRYEPPGSTVERCS